MGRRLTLSDFSSTQRQDLVDLIMEYLTDDIVDLHATFIHSGEMLFTHHRQYIEGMEEYLAANGGESFVPLPKWDPSTQIPNQFNIVKPQDDGTPRPPLVNLNPNLPVPPEFVAPALCSFTSGDELGNAINGWHGTVHVTIDGTMGILAIASAAPIFWCWHGFIDDVYWDWQNCFGAPPENQPQDRERRERKYMDSYRKYYASRRKEIYKHKEHYMHQHGSICCECHCGMTHQQHGSDSHSHHFMQKKGGKGAKKMARHDHSH